MDPSGVALSSDDFLRDVGKCHTDVLRPLKRRHEVEVGDVHGHELHILRGDDAVEE